MKLSNSHLNKLKSAIKNGTEITLNLSSKFIGSSNDETNFLQKLLLTHTQLSKIRKAFANCSSAKIKFSKTQLHKIGQSGGFLGRLLGPLLKTGLLLIWNILKPLAKSILLPLGLTEAASVTDTTIQKKTYGSGTTNLIISNEIKMEDIMKTVKCLEESGLLIKGFSETIKNETKK